MQSSFIPCQAKFGHSSPRKAWSFKIMQNCVIPRHAKLCNSSSCKARPFKIMQSCVIPRHAQLCHSSPCKDGSFLPMQSFVIPSHAKFCHSFPCTTVSFLPVQSYVIPRHAKLGHSRSCTIVSFLVIKRSVLSALPRKTIPRDDKLKPFEDRISWTRPLRNVPKLNILKAPTEGPVHCLGKVMDVIQNVGWPLLYHFSVRTFLSLAKSFLKRSAQPRFLGQSQD
jgi:hypothetical protein